jgi:hypothetical protein
VFGIRILAPNLDTGENGSWHSVSEYAEIAPAIADLNPEAAAIYANLRTYVRPLPNAVNSGGGTNPCRLHARKIAPGAENRPDSGFHSKFC